MPSQVSPLYVRMTELLSPEGTWHDWETVRRELAKAVPPGEAARFVEAQRKSKVEARKRQGLPINPTTAKGQRVVERSETFLIEAGKRALATKMLQADRVEHSRTAEGRKLVRLRPPALHHRTAARLAREAAERGAKVAPPDGNVRS